MQGPQVHLTLENNYKVHFDALFLCCLRRVIHLLTIYISSHQAYVTFYSNTGYHGEKLALGGTTHY